MKRFFIPSLLAVAVLSCAEQPSAPLPGDAGPAFAISDGAHGGNARFYFKPPLVPSTSFTGVFTPSAAPSVVICRLASGSCAETVKTFGPSEISVSLVDEQYQVNWKTGTDQGIFFPQLYRIQVFAAGTLLGFRDVAPKDSPTEVPRNPETDAFYAFLNGSTIPIKFRIERGFFCETVDFDDIDGECNEGNLQNGIVVQIPETGTGVSVPAQQTLTGFVALIIEPCLDSSGNPADLPVDIPLYGPCFEVRTVPALSGPLNPLGTVFVCEPVSGDHRIDDLVRLHKTQALDGSAPVFALPNGPGLCPGELARADEPAGWLARLARGAQTKLASVLRPTPLHASVMLDRGRGGLTEGFSFFQFAMPSKMAILEGDGQAARAGTAVAIPPAVRVTDLDDFPVVGARVTFSVGLGNGTVVPTAPIVTGADGIARVTSWTLGDPGINTLLAQGRGIAVPGNDGPRPTFDPFTPIQMPNPADEIPTQLSTGTLTFTAVACDPNATPVLDGVIGAGEWSLARVFPFTANLSGGSTPATLYVMNDCDNLYLAVRIARSETDRVNTVRFDFDNNDNGVAEAGDDFITFDGGTLQFIDGFLTAKCANSNQSACGDTDVSAGGTTDGAGTFRNSGGFSVYELRHPLKSGDARDFQLSFGQRIGLFTTVRLGNGAQGNTQWPGFRVYQRYTVTIPGAP